MSRALAGVSIVFGGVLAFSFLLAVATNDGAPESSASQAAAQVYERHDDCETPCFESAASDSFTVVRDMAEVQLVIFVVLDPATGPAQITVTDPAGDVRYERVFTSDTPRAATQDAATWGALPGEWTLTRTYLSTVGTVSYDAWVVGLPE